MRSLRLLKVVSVLGALVAAAVPARTNAQVKIHASIGTRLGPTIGLHVYSPGRMGAWRSSYRRWTPVTVYRFNGHYYRQPVRGARTVIVYSFNNEYFLPPPDRAWIGFDNRYDYRWRPIDEDGWREEPASTAIDLSVDFGPDIDVYAYSPVRYGEWRSDYVRWAPVTIYEYRGRYYPHAVRGGRAVVVYRSGNEHFFPPRESAWVGFDRRVDYKHRPNDGDHGRARGRH